jgi:MFS family permease
MLIVLRMLCGVGFAGVKTVINTVVSFGSNSDETRGRNLTEMNAGLLGGITCGGSLGAIIFGSLGFSCNFIIAAVILAGFTVLTIAVIPWEHINPNTSETLNDSAKPAQNPVLMLAKGTVRRFILLVTIPLNVGLMFIVSFLPGYVVKLNLPPLLISYGYLFNGIAGIYIGPPLAKALTRKLGKPACISIMLLMGAASMLACAVSPGISTILFAAALMGLFDGFGTPVSMDYFIEMPQIRNNIGDTGALAMLSVLGNAVQMISPMLYGTLMAVSMGAGINAIVVLAAVYFGFAAVFIVSQRRHSIHKAVA